jgi:serpin B
VGWGDLTVAFHEAPVHLTVPSLRLDHARRLDADLAALGMGIAFAPPRADFTRLADAGPERLYLSRVDQRTFVEVNEGGTEAAAPRA